MIKLEDVSKQIDYQADLTLPIRYANLCYYINLIILSSEKRKETRYTSHSITKSFKVGLGTTC